MHCKKKGMLQSSKNAKQATERMCWNKKE